MAKIKNGKNYQKSLLHQLEQQQQSIQKNIKKFKQAPSEEKIIEGKVSPYMLLERRTKREEQKYNIQKKIRLPYNQEFYPEVPNLSFPNQLLDCIIKVICSFGNSAKHNQITKNLSLFYTNEVQEELVNFILAESEESGTIYELEGKFKVTSALIQKQYNDQIGQKMKHEDIDENDNDQYHSPSNDQVQSKYSLSIIEDREIEAEIS